MSATTNEGWTPEQQQRKEYFAELRKQLAAEERLAKVKANGQYQEACEATQWGLELSNLRLLKGIPQEKVESEVRKRVALSKQDGMTNFTRQTARKEADFLKNRIPK